MVVYIQYYVHVVVDRLTWSKPWCVITARSTFSDLRKEGREDENENERKRKKNPENDVRGSVRDYTRYIAYPLFIPT